MCEPASWTKIEAGPRIPLAEREGYFAQLSNPLAPSPLEYRGRGEQAVSTRTVGSHALSGDRERHKTTSMIEPYLTTTRLDPHEALVALHGEGWTGRLMGPRCRVRQTVEIAHYFRRAAGSVLLRATVPEPSFWSPKTPFTYEAILRKDGVKVAIRHAFRSSAIVKQRLRLNFNDFPIVALRRDNLADHDVEPLRLAGYNTIVTRVSPETAEVWDCADLSGFCVIGLIARDPESVTMAIELNRHPSAVAWLLDGYVDLLEPERLRTSPGRGAPLGVLGDFDDAPEWIQFTASRQRLDPRPWLRLTDDSSEAIDAMGIMAGEDSP